MCFTSPEVVETTCTGSALSKFCHCNTGVKVTAATTAAAAVTATAVRRQKAPERHADRRVSRLGKNTTPSEASAASSSRVGRGGASSEYFALATNSTAS